MLGELSMEVTGNNTAQASAGMHPYAAFLAEQADLIDIPHLVEALVWFGVSTPEGGTEAAAARLGRLVNDLSAAVLRHKTDHQQRAVAAQAVDARRGASQQDHYSPAELRAFNAGRAFAERIARAEQNTRSLAITKIALDGLVEYSSHAAAQQIVRFLYPDLADLADQDPALARRALNALQPY